MREIVSWTVLTLVLMMNVAASSAQIFTPLYDIPGTSTLADGLIPEPGGDVNNDGTPDLILSRRGAFLQSGAGSACAFGE